MSNPPDDLDEFEVPETDLSNADRGKYYESAARAWDRQMEADAAAGKLDKVAEEALAELDRGETTDL
jgi:hypothetical protein